MADITVNDEDGPCATVAAGLVPRSWLHPRAGATARLTGTYAAITHADSIAALRPIFLPRARDLGLEDLDAAALKDARPRALTQQVATHVYETTDLDGVQFLSRHGDDHLLWAIFERPADPPRSAPTCTTPLESTPPKTCPTSPTPSASTTSPDQCTNPRRYGGHVADRPT